MCFSFTKDVPRERESLRTLPFVLKGALSPIYRIVSLLCGIIRVKRVSRNYKSRVR